MIRYFLFLILLSFHTGISAYELPKSCHVNATDCSSCKKDPAGNLNSLEALNSKISGPIERFELFSKKARELKNSNIVLKNKLASMFRSLRDGESEPTFKSGMAEVNSIEEDFKKLTLLAKEAAKLESRFNFCLTNCSPVRRLEILDDIKKIQNLKVALLIGRPILANAHFENLFKKMTPEFVSSEKNIEQSVFRDHLKEALFDNLQVILKYDTEYSRFESDPRAPILEKASPANIDEYNSGIISRFPLISESIVKDLSLREISTENTNVCFFAKNFQTYTRRQGYQELALDVGLFALPFALGPAGRMGGFAVEAFFGERLALWGLGAKELGTVIKVSDITLQGALISHEANAIFKKINECKQTETDLIQQATEEKLKSLDQCKRDLSDKILFAEISSISLATSTIAPKVIQTFSKLSPPSIKTPKVLSLISKDFGGGKNAIIKKEIESMMKATAEEKKALSHLSSTPALNKAQLNNVLKKQDIEIEKGVPTILSGDKLELFKKDVTKDTVELLYIPGSEIPFLPNAVNKVGHVAIRVGNKVYHQTGGSGFKIESFDDFLNKTKKNYKVFGTVMQASEKEMKVMETYFKKMHDKQLPYSFLVNNCAQAVCKAMKLADFENVAAPMNFDPVLSLIAAKRSERVMMKTMYNADKDMSVEELRKATVNNRLAFYGIPAAAAGTAALGTFEAADFLIEYLNQAKEIK